MLRALVDKEVKDLIRDPRIWIPVLIGFLILPIMGVIQNISVSSQISQGYGAQVSVQVLLLGSYDGSRDFLEILKNMMRSYNISYMDKEGSFPKEADALVIINASSIESLAKGRRLEAYVLYKTRLTSSLSRQDVAIRIQQSIVDASRIYIARINNITSILPTLIIPSLIYSIPYLQDRNAIIASFDISQFFLLTFIQIIVPMILLMISVFIMQYSAISMAIENEEKTLEILLSMPIPRRNIVLAKLAASGIIGALSLAGLGLGLLIYTNLLVSSVRVYQTPGTIIASNSAQQIGSIPLQIIESYMHDIKILNISSVIDISPLNIGVITIYAIETILLAGIVGTLIGGVSSDVRMANTISGSLAPILIIFWFAVIFTDPSYLPVYVLLSNPLTGLPFYSRIAFIEGYSSPDIYTYLIVSGLEVVFVAIVAEKALNLEMLERLRRGLTMLRRSR